MTPPDAQSTAAPEPRLRWYQYRLPLPAAYASPA